VRQLARGFLIPATRRYHPLVCAKLAIDTSLLKPGMRLAVGLSGGADSVALVCALHERAGELGLVLHAAHLHHGLRGEEADGDLEFCRELATNLNVEFHEARVDTAAESQAKRQTIEEAARHLRYAWFRRLLSETPLHAVATAHTRDDQAETVLARFLRGAWTEGLSGICPMLELPEGRVLRPLLGTARGEIEAYLNAIGQGWREDSSNRHLTYTRNRIRHVLLPLLEGWNPRLREHMAQMAALARDEEAWWRAELDRIAPQLLLPGKPARGGGRATSADPAQSLALDVTRLAALAPAVQRRLLRRAAEQLGAVPDFAATESLRALALDGRAGQKLELAGGLRAERSPRELRLEPGSPGPANRASGTDPRPPGEYAIPIPGEIAAPEFGIRIRIEACPGERNGPAPAPAKSALLRNWRAGDRVRLRHSAGPHKVKEVLERMKVTGTARAAWPVLEIDGRVVWMRGVELEPLPGISVSAASVEKAQGPGPL
jgi:tRNA(Ile)-lysidine synthase